MSRNGIVASSSTVAIGGHPKGIAMADLNGAGKADLAVANNGDNTVTVILSP